MSQPAHPPAGPPFSHAPFVRPLKPEVPLGRALLWTCVFSLLGVVLLVATVLLFLLVVLLVILGAVAAIADSFTWQQVIDDLSVRGLAEFGLGFGAVFVTVGLVSTVLSAGMLLLLRLVRDFRTWGPVLQGLTAAGATYFAGSTLFAMLGRVGDVLSG